MTKITKEFLKVPNNKKLLVIVGPTASGKTKLALRLAKKYNGELVSADSRQIYKYMDIGTGKDIKNFQFSIFNFQTNNKNIVYYQDPKSLVKIWGLDLINPNQEFSVAQWVEWTKEIINNIQSKNKLAIVVGGTGFWIKALIWGIEWGKIKPNIDLRSKIYDLRIEKLQERLKKYDKKFGRKLSASDWLNKRRLIRRIEIAEYFKKHPKAKVAIEGIDKSIKVETIILGSMIYDLRSEIEKRIRKRLKQGLLREIKQLLTKGYSFKDPGMNSLGYKEFKDYFEWMNCHPEFISGSPKMLKKTLKQVQGDSVSVQHDKGQHYLKQAIIKWQKDEIDYARRQGLFIRKYLVNQ